MIDNLLYTIQDQLISNVFMRGTYHKLFITISVSTYLFLSISIVLQALKINLNTHVYKEQYDRTVFECSRGVCPQSTPVPTIATGNLPFSLPPLPSTSN